MPDTCAPPPPWPCRPGSAAPAESEDPAGPGRDRQATRHHTIELSTLRLHYAEAGQGRALILLHDWPGSAHAWRAVIPDLARRFRVIAPDLRGVGHSDNPAHGYDKRTVAADVGLLMDALGIERAYVAGHGIGAAVGFALAATERERVRALIVIEMVLPGTAAPPAGPAGRGGGVLWYMDFHALPDLPELLLAGREAAYLGWLYRRFAHDPTFMAAEDLAVHVQACLGPGRLARGLQYHRTLARDGADVRRWAARKLAIPVLALGGASSLREAPALALRALADCVEGGIVERGGHWLPEERPAELALRIKRFLHPAHLRALTGRFRGSSPART